jgi:cytochrome-b5 reductase
MPISNRQAVLIALPVGVTMMAVLSAARHLELLPSQFDPLSEENINNPNIAIILGVLSVVFATILHWPPSSKKKVMPLADYLPIPLLRKEILSHDTRRFTFGLPTKDHVLGLPTGQHVSLKFTATIVDEATGKKEKKPIIRSYTPVTDDVTGVPGEFSLVIKVYRPLPPKFPNGGYMSQHLDDLNIGDTILMKGPKGHLHYTNQMTSSVSLSGMMASTFTVKPLGKPLETRSAQYYGMMAGGTGITPMLQVLQCMFRHGPDSHNPHVCVKLIYANQTVNDILVRDLLEALQRDFPTRFQLYYTVDQVPAAAENGNKKWEYGVGFINKDMIQKHLLFADGKQQQQQFFMCGTFVDGKGGHMSWGDLVCVCVCW